MAALVAIAVPAIAAAWDTPSFESYPASVSCEAAKVAPVDLSSHPRAKRFRTMLRLGAASGPNFAGGFTFVSWGCGVACQEFAIVEACTGRVYFPPKVKLNAYHAVTDESEPLDYRLDSRLLILRGSPNDTDETGVFYYEWTGTDLRLISKVLRTWPR